MVVNIAKNIITLSAINDAFSVSFSPNTCVIKADYDGNNPQLNSAYTDISLKRGEKKAKYELTHKTSSNNSIAYKVSTIDEYTKRIQLTAIPNSVVSGYLIFDIDSDEGYNSTITFQFSVIRESTMLDWIQDWETNKTTIGSTYLITPKIFVGKKVTDEDGLDTLTGVYIGPDATSAGIYGYKEGKDIFHINESGGVIGGWEIDRKGIQSSDGLFKILSEGTIKAEDNSGEVIWAIQKTGDATFSKGKVRLNKDGSAYFEGNITSAAGIIGGWSIGENLLHSDYLILDSSRHYIGISPFDISTLDEIDNTFNHKSYVEEKGGVCMFYTSANSYGIEGYLPANTSSEEIRQVFSLGSMNQISGWNMSEKKLASKHVVLVSDDTASGIYMSTTDIDQTSPSNLVGAIEDGSGIYLYSTEHEAKLVGMKTSGVVFSLSSTTDSIIAGWKFNDTAIFKGALTTSGFTQSSGDITISSEGIRGHKWRLDADGNGAIANGEIYWDTDGVHFGENVKLSWNNFSDEAKDDMQNGLLPDWVNDWDKVENKTEIGGEYIVSPRIFSGNRDQESGKLTGIAIGRECITIDGQKRTGIFAVDGDKIMLELDPLNKKYRFSGTILAQIDENNVWEVNSDCINVIGNPTGKHIEISPISSDIKIFKENGEISSVFDGNEYNSLDELFSGTAEDVQIINMPHSDSHEETSKFAGSVTTTGHISNIFKTVGNVILVYSGKISLSQTISSGGSALASIIVSVETYEDQNRIKKISSKTLMEASLNRTDSTSYTISTPIRISLTTGYNEITVTSKHEYGSNSIGSNSTVSVDEFSAYTVLAGYVSQYFANGMALGSSNANLFSVLNTEEGRIVSTFCNDRYGVKFDNTNLLSKRNGRWGILPSIICCGRIAAVAGKATITKLSAFDGRTELAVYKLGTGYVRIVFHPTWVDMGINSANCYIMLTGIGRVLGSTTTGGDSALKATMLDWDENSIYIGLSDDATANDGDFYFEIKSW